MKPELQAILDIILNAVDELNRQLPETGKLDRDHSAILFGGGGVLDSLSLITLMIGIEQGLRSKFGLSPELLEQEQLADPDGPYRSIGSLANWILTNTH